MGQHIRQHRGISVPARSLEVSREQWRPTVLSNIPRAQPPGKRAGLWIRDQLFLSAEGASDEEILLERRRLASDFDWNFGFGLSYQFGSIYNNVVNNRF